MESVEKWNKDFIALKLLDKKLHSKKNGTTGSCPNLIMSRNEQPEQKPVIMALTPQLPVRTHRPLCLSVSSDSNGRFRALESQDWKNNLKAQVQFTHCARGNLYNMEQAHSAGAASSTGSLERASLFCASGSNTSSSSLSSPVEPLTKSKSSSRFSLFSPPWNSSSESDSNPPSRSGSKKVRNYNKRGGNKAEDALDSKQSIPEHFQFSEPVIAKVTDYIYVGNLNAAYSGRILCRNSIDSVIDMSSFAGEHKVGLIPCTCSRGTKHSWSRLKVDISGLSDEESVALKQRSFEDINECIDASTEKRKRVLIHCRDGYSLAPTCIIQYLMVKQNMRLIAAYEFVRAKYPVNIQECHQNLLVNLEKALRPGGNVDPECFKQAISRKMAWT
ncbi:dual specificity protein phosphatase 10-like isoform X2 [Acipenser oxyrinchus oxyrinchus]|uniref:protein-tyrosine-phosphatase n=1 Tax=Acipenser oxyrinchus oxyrinchus TaxID=40147 RepID=A0AAD8FXM5_ACIOX|nr:dual specificity protein phosphatase 10-like isoform X2 [Acipenser oxyrinchus oxyrinchus]